MQVLDGERTLFLQSTASTGLALVHIQYGNITLATLPILINTPEGIAARKENKKLMEALQALHLISPTS
ncbi:MAG: hypothetical protein LBP53_08280 [Candidatus Peribacteria bacterium]|jgi:hypothetical protein|nr:hypothetical protein [Candidatus Peribacteria bacterium]